MATTRRRLRPAAAASRGEANRAQQSRTTEERGTDFVRTEVKDRQGVYYEVDREVEVLRETFSEDNPPAFVKVGAGLTINLGNFESLRIDCSVTVPCGRERLKEGHEIASQFVADRISEEQTNWLGGADKTRGKAR